MLEKHRVDFKDVAKLFESDEFIDIQPVADSMEENSELRESFMGEVDGTVYRGILTRRNNDYRLITARRAGKKKEQDSMN